MIAVVRGACAWTSRIADRLGRAFDGPAPGRRDAAIAAAMAAVALALACGQVWRRHAVPLWHDEYAYELQARTLLDGRVTLPAVPLPEFFEAPHVLVVPTYGAKYFPGHAALLAPFTAARVEWLLPCIEFAATAAALYLLLRNARLDRGGSAFACAVHLLSGRNLLMATTLLSHGTSTLLALASLLVLARIRRADARWPVLVASALTGWAMLTRPYSAIAMAIPLAIALVRVRARAPAIAIAAAPLLVALGLGLAFDKAVTGSATTTPWSLWARQYTPFDGPGFGPPSLAAPERPLPQHMVYLSRIYWSTRSTYTLDALPRTAWHRFGDLFELLPSAALALLAPLGAGACWRRRQLGLLFGFTSALFLLNLTFHASLWQYFIDLYPALAALCGVGFAAVLSVLRATKDVQTNRDAQLLAAGVFFAALAAYAPLFDVDPLPAPVLLVGLIAAVATLLSSASREYPLGRALLAAQLALGMLHAVPETWWSLRALRPARAHPYVGSMESKIDRKVATYRAFELARDRVAARRGILFVRYPVQREGLDDLPIINPGLGTRSDPPVIVAVDLGRRDRELLAAFPGRPGFVFDAERLTLAELDAVVATGGTQ
jgi:hypothetical protein